MCIETPLTVQIMLFLTYPCDPREFSGPGMPALVSKLILTCCHLHGGECRAVNKGPYAMYLAHSHWEMRSRGFRGGGGGAVLKNETITLGSLTPRV